MNVKFDFPKYKILIKVLPIGLLCIASFRVTPQVLNPAHQGSLTGLPLLYNPSAVYVSGNLAFVSASGGISIIDISTPAAPDLKSTIFLKDPVLNGPKPFFVVGSYIYVATYLGFSIIDFSNVNNPLVVGSISNGVGGAQLDNASSVCVSGTLAYVASESNVLEILDVSDVTKPTHVGNVVDGNGYLNYAISVVVSGNYVYAAASNALVIIDVSDPGNPVIAGTLLDGQGGAKLSGPNDVFVSGNYAFVANTSSSATSTENALEIIDISNPNAPVHAANISNGDGGAILNSPRSVYVKDNYAYVASAFSSSLEIVDITNPLSPIHAGSVIDNTNGAFLNFASSVFVSGNNAYVASTLSNALEIINVSKPATPTHLSALEGITRPDQPNLVEANCVFVSGNYAYVTSTIALEIVDITRPNAPVHKGKILNGTNGALLNSPSSVFVGGGYAYVVSQYSNSLEIIDVSDPENPQHKGSLVDGAGGAMINFPHSVYVQGNYAYIASTNSSALEIVDVSNPASPQHAGNLTNGVSESALFLPNSVYVIGNYAYLVGGTNALEIVDVSAPNSPTHIGKINDGSGGAKLNYPLAVFVSGKYAYVVSNVSDALEIIDVSAPNAPVHVGSATQGTGGAVLSDSRSVFVSGNYAYVTTTSYPSNGTDALEIFDISNPSNPIHAAILTNGTGGTILNRPVSVFFSKDFAYVASSNSNSLEVISVFKPDAPQLSPAYNVTETSFAIKWNKPVGAVSFQVDVSIDNFSSTLAGYDALVVNDTTLNMAGLSPGALYYYRVRSSNASGFSSYAFSSVVLIPSFPVALPATKIASISFQANWKSSKGAVGYLLDVSNDNFNTFLTGYDGILVTDTIKSIAGILYSSPFQYRVRAYNTSGVSENSNVVSLLITDVELTNDDITVYPNPTQGIFSISNLSSPLDHVELIDCLGHSVPVSLENQENGISGNISHLSAGIYVLTILKSNRNYHIKLVKD